MSKVIAEDGLERKHRACLAKLLDGTRGPIRVASAYVTERQLFAGSRERDIRLLTSVSPLDIASGATSVEALRAVIESGVQCRFLPDRPRLHAKVYLFGTRTAVVTSANLTESAFSSNIEVGIELTDKNVQCLIEWFGRLWESADRLSLSILRDLKDRTRSIRREYGRLQAISREVGLSSRSLSAGLSLGGDSLNLFDSTNRFFICNTGRVDKHLRTGTGGYLWEELMHDAGYAAAWADFNYPTHMEQVKPGDSVFMYASGHGIIGIGRATGTCEKLAPNDPDRIRDRESIVEWRVPVEWVDWRDDEDAYPWKSPRCTFVNVSDDKYSDLREGVEQLFGV